MHSSDNGLLSLVFVQVWFSSELNQMLN